MSASRPRGLRAAGVVSAGDLCQRAADPQVRRAWTGVDGPGWVTWQYFCALNGIDELKPDVMLTHFVSEMLGRRLGGS